jgi:hypothetical protein
VALLYIHIDSLIYPYLARYMHAFSFTELDSFGPSGNALGPPADMAEGELEGRLEFDPKRDLSIDFLQSPPSPLKLN